MNRWKILGLIAAFEVGLIAFSLAASVRVRSEVRAVFDSGPADVAWGLAVGFACLLGLSVVMRSRRSNPIGRLGADIERVVDELFIDCGPLQLAIISVLAGIGEEIFFRSWMQMGYARLVSLPIALVAASAIFGLLHAITARYAIYAASLGLVFGTTLIVSGGLLAPIIAHALFDFIGLSLLVPRRRIGQFVMDTG